MKWRSTLAVVWIGAGTVFGQAPGAAAPEVGEVAVDPAKQPVSIDHHFAKGDTFELELIKSSRVGNGKATPIKFFIDVEVLDVNEAGEATLGWTQRLSQTLKDLVDTATTPAELQAAALLQAADGLRFEFVLGWDGSVQEIKNFAAVRERMLKAIDAVEAGLKAKGTPPEQVEMATAMARAMFADEDRAAPLMLKEPAAYFQAYSFELTPGEPLVYDVELPNAWGGPAFPGEMKIELVDYEPAAGTVKLSGLQSIKGEEARAALIETLKRVAERMGKPIPANEEETLAKTPLTMDTDFSYRYDRASGLIELAKVTVSVKFGEQSKTETAQMKLIKSAKAPVAEPVPTSP